MEYKYPSNLTITFINILCKSTSMELVVLEENKQKMVFELKGETHTFCNLLKKELQGNKEVNLVSYRIDHPLVGVPRFILETKGTEPRKVLKEALKSLTKKTEELTKEIAKL